MSDTGSGYDSCVIREVYRWFLFFRGGIGYQIASTASHEIAIQGYVWENVDLKCRLLDAKTVI